MNGLTALGRRGISFVALIVALFKDVPHDSNMICSCVLRILEFIIKDKKRLPKRLVLITDNTTRENKNHTVLSFLGMLVGLEIFEHASIGFLMVGHTHGKNDQVHSQISQ